MSKIKIRDKIMDEKRIEELEKRPFWKIFPEKLDALKANKCTTCGNPITQFKNEISKKEYSISGMCQNCQDSVFDNYDEEDKTWEEE